MNQRDAGWPALPYEDWRQTKDTLHMYTQVIGKLRLSLSPFEPQWGHVPLYVTARGLTTSPIPLGLRTIDLEMDLIGHELVIRSSDDRSESRPLGGDVAGFYGDVMEMLRLMGVDVSISVVPSEVSDPIPFPDDHTHDTYVPEHARRFFQVLSMVDVVMKEHRALFRGRTTPVQFFWGTFDLAVTRYSGRAVEPPPDAGLIRRVGGDAEAICAGWWAGDERVPYPAFFAYGYPAPDGIDRVVVEPREAAWSSTSGEFLLPYDTVRSSSDPRRTIRDFLNSTYLGAASVMGWSTKLAEV
ncbi:MAG TPA: DUF5996 family protein [Candidatus Micrarchaeaceae archaeon]|nr:DUF5996 family protein [Candidatus Micrarchaeaceae archaeon]